MAKDPAERPASTKELVRRFLSIATELRDTRELVADAFAGTAVEWREETPDRFVFTVTLPGGRHQTVFGDIIPANTTHDRLASFWTPCAPANPDHFRYVLAMNQQLPFGAVCIRSYNNQDYFVMTSNHARATLDPPEIRTAVLNMAAGADRIEQQLTGNDVH